MNCYEKLFIKEKIEVVKPNKKVNFSIEIARESSVVPLQVRDLDFRYDEINKNGFNNEMMDYFFSIRHDLFNEEYLRQCGFGPANYVKSFKKNYEHLKK